MITNKKENSRDFCRALASSGVEPVRIDRNKIMSHGESSFQRDDPGLDTTTVSLYVPGDYVVPFKF